MFLFATYMYYFYTSKSQTENRKGQSPPPVLWKRKPTAFGEGASAVLECRRKVIHDNEPPYTPSQKARERVEMGMPGKMSGCVCSGQGWGRRLVCLAVGWTTGFLDTGLTQRDHLDPLRQHPHPEQTQEGTLEKHQCDNWSHLHPGWVNTAWESDVILPNFVRYWGGVGRCFPSWQPHPRSSFISHSTCLTLPGYVPLMFCTSHHLAVRVHPSPGQVGLNISCNPR